MSAEILFRDAKKGYDKTEVHEFLDRLNYEHEEELSKKNDEIKTLTAEKQRTEERLNARIAELEKQLAEEQASNAEGAAKYEQLCAQIGEKLLFAEKQSSAVLAEAEASKSQIEREARERADRSVADITARAKESAASAIRAADVLKQKSQLINAALEQTKRIVEDAIAQIEKTANQ